MLFHLLRGNVNNGKSFALPDPPQAEKEMPTWQGKYLYFTFPLHASGLFIFGPILLSGYPLPKFFQKKRTARHTGISHIDLYSCGGSVYI
jgi:hypothetical protein